MTTQPPRSHLQNHSHHSPPHHGDSRASNASLDATDDPGADWEVQCAGVAVELAAAGVLECELAERVAAYLRRLRRIDRWETAIASGRYSPNPTKSTSPPSIERELAERELRRARDSLARCTALVAGYRRLENAEDAAVFDGRLAFDLVQNAHEVTARAAYESVAAGEFLSELGVPPRHHASPDLWLGWTALVIRRGLAMIARINGTSAAAVLDRALGTTQTHRDDDAARVKRLEKELAERRAEEAASGCPILESDALERLARYEAHANRQLFLTLKLFAKLQGSRNARKSTRTKPVARHSRKTPRGDRNGSANGLLDIATVTT